MIWLTGAHGMLGHDLGQALTRAGLPWTGSGREVDIASPEAVRKASPPGLDWVINAAAYTSVDKAEDEPEACRRANVQGPACLSEWCAERGAGMVHISTDYVFSGNAARPYSEDDEVDPQGVYGQTKAEGEEAVRLRCPRHFIVRTAWLYGAHGPNFVYTMLRLMRQKPELGVVADQIGSPTWTSDLAHAILTMLGTGSSWGTYHASGEGSCSWHEFAQAVGDEAVALGLLDRRVPVKPLATSEYPTKARRPAWSLLSKDKLRESFALVFPHWRDSLRSFLSSPLEARYLS